MATDRTSVFEAARLVSALLGTAAVALLIAAGRRLGGAATGLIAGALLAVAFLPVHYAHLALNDAPTLAPACLALLGVADDLPRNGYGGYAIAGLALGVACATKYTAGILRADDRRRRARDARAGPACCAGCCSPACWRWRASWSPTRSRCSTSPRSATGSATSRRPPATAAASSASRPTAGSSTTSAPLTWGLGWLPALAALGGAIGLALRDRRLALVLVPAPLVFLIFMGTQDRFFARWLLPVYPLLCLLAAWAVGRRGRSGSPRRLRQRSAVVAGVLGALLCLQGLVFSIHNDRAARPPGHPPARPRLDGRQRPDPLQGRGRAVPARRLGGRRAERPRGHRQRLPLEQVADHARARRDGGGVIRFEDYERTPARRCSAPTPAAASAGS